MQVGVKVGKLQGQRKIMGEIKISARTTLRPGLVSVESQPEGTGCLSGRPSAARDAESHNLGLSPALLSSHWVPFSEQFNIAQPHFFRLQNGENHIYLPGKLPGSRAEAQHVNVSEASRILHR